MANYYGQTRSNYFFVKDAEAFKAELAKYPVEIITQEKDGKTLYGFMDTDPNGGGDASSYYDEEEQDSEMDWADFFKRHLADGWVAIIMHTGAEKYRYLGGQATAFNNKGEEMFISLEDIYTLATQIGENITRAEW